MNPGFQIQAFESALKDRKANLSKDKIRFKDLTPKGDNEFAMRGHGEVTLDEKALRQYLQYVNIPYSFYQNHCDREMQIYLIGRMSDGKNNDRLNPIIYKDEVIGWGSEFRPLVHLWDAYQIVAGNLSTLGGELTIHGGTHYSQDTFVNSQGGVISWSTDALVTEPKVGDITEGGIRMGINDWMDVSPTLSFYVNRLICSNGMTMEYKYPTIEVESSSDKILDEINRISQSLASEINEKILLPWKHSASHDVDDPLAFAHSMAKDRGMGKRLADRFLENVTNMVQAGSGPWSMYDVINCLTAVQNEDNIRWSERERIQLIGAHETIDHTDRCRTCHHII